MAFESILNLAIDGSQLISGETPSVPSKDPDKSKSASPRVVGKKPATGEKIKPATKCLGCGTTETPEWRRGPMGPRSLCNACVSEVVLRCQHTVADRGVGLGAYEVAEEEEKD